METSSALSVIFSVIVGWLLLKTFWVVKQWYEYRHGTLSTHIPAHPKSHWFWGMAHLAKNMDDLMHLRLEYVRQKKPKWIRCWLIFLYPDIFLCHPSTIQAVVTAKNVPKHHGLGGPYRMLLPWLGDGLLNSNGKKWERNRRLLTPAFHFNILKPYVDIFNHVSDVFLEKIQELSQGGDSIDIYPLVSRATLHSMLRCTLSYDDDTLQNVEEHHPYVVAVQKLSRLLVKRAINPLLHVDIIYRLTSDCREFQSTCDYVHEVATKLIAARRKEIEADPSQLDKRHLDFLDILITAKDEHSLGLTDQEIRDEVDTFMFEGHDTTASAISWAINSLAKYPDMQEKVRQEVEQVLDGRRHLTADDLSKLTYTTCFIKESLRMYTPVALVLRRLSEPLVVDGVTLPAGFTIFIDTHVAHHNPAVWEDDQEFRPERFTPENMKKDPYAFIPFSAGQRNCIGQHFALNEIKIMVANIVTRYNIMVDPKREAVPFLELILRAKDGIHLYFKER